MNIELDKIKYFAGLRQAVNSNDTINQDNGLAITGQFI